MNTMPSAVPIGKWVHVVVRIGFGLLFVWASWDKLLDPRAFAEVIRNYRLLPEFLVPVTAVILPWIELLCGLCLVLGFMSGGSILILDALLLVFTVSLGISLYRGLNINCGCFSLDPEGEKVAWTALIRDGVLLLTGFMILLRERGRGRPA
jgi:hypothetical protein